MSPLSQKVFHKMNTGMLVIGRADIMGLGSMTADFCRALEPERVVLIDTLRGLPIDMGPFADRPDNVTVIRMKDWQSDPAIIIRELANMKIVVGFETFYSDLLPSLAKGNSTGPTKSAMFPMWECSPGSVAESDFLFYLSGQDANFYGPDKGIRCTWPASPVVYDPDRVINSPPRRFVHAAGNAAHNRNSTQQVLEASLFLKGTGAELHVYHSFRIPGPWMPAFGAPVKFCGSVPSRRDLLVGCDCFVHPQQFEGLSLPISEAAAERIPIIAVDLPQWRGWTHTVSASPAGHKRFTQSVEMFAPDPVELGELMRGLALGTVAPITPQRQPTWDEFKADWARLTAGSHAAPADSPAESAV
jgi:hypothetical protein